MQRIVASTSRKRPADATSASTPVLPALAIIPRTLVSERVLTGVDFRLILFLYIRRARDTAWGGPQIEMAEALAVNRRTIRDSLTRLSACGVVSIIRNSRASGAYRRLSYRLMY